MVWTYTPRGNFIVRRAYRLVAGSRIGNIFKGASNEENRKIFWKTIWRLNIPNKVKSFAWKASKNILPTKANLCRRKVLVNPICEAYDTGIENSAHLFWECDKAREVWQAFGLTFDNHGLVFHEFVDLLWRLKFSRCVEDDTLELVLMIAWNIRHNRNQVQHGKARQLSRAILHKARVLLEEFQIANFSMPHFVSDEATHWVASLSPGYKVNVDGGTFTNSQSSRIGVIIWDIVGQMEAAMSKRLPISLGTLESETKALEEGVLFAWDVGVREVVFKSDSKIIIDALQEVNEALATICYIIEGIQQKLQDFRSMQVNHVKQEGNRPAHNLAQHANDVFNYVTWIKKNPNMIESSLAQDVLFLSSS